MNDFIYDAKQVISLSKGKKLFGSAAVRIVAAEVDSRRCKQNYLFCCIDGENTKGSLFIEDAINNGANLILVDKKYKLDKEFFNKDLENKVCIIATKNPLKALQNLAKKHLENFTDLLKIGITGSSGKTTTRELLSASLATKYEVFSTTENFNSDIGLPLMALKIRVKHNIAVLEMGIDRIGEMALLADIFRPDIAIITNIGVAHLGKFKSLENIAREKSNILKYFSKTAVAFINEKDLKYFKKEKNKNLKFFSLAKLDGYEIEDRDSVYGPIIKFNNEEFNFPLVGEHNLENLALVLEVAKYLGLNEKNVFSASSNVILPSHRNSFIEGRVAVFEDCYNANPESMKAGVDFFKKVNWDGRKIAVFASMKELGTLSKKYHSDFGYYLNGTELDEIFFYGEEMLDAYTALKDSSFENTAYWCENFDDLLDLLGEKTKEGDLLLIKGSRSMKLERITSFLKGLEGEGSV